MTLLPTTDILRIDPFAKVQMLALHVGRYQYSTGLEYKIFFFYTGQEENANDIKLHYEKDNFDAVFETIVDVKAYFKVQRDPTVTFIFPWSQMLNEVIFSARQQAALPVDGTATPSNTHSPVRSDGSSSSSDIMLRLLGGLVDLLVAFFAYLMWGRNLAREFAVSLLSTDITTAPDTNYGGSCDPGDSSTGSCDLADKNYGGPCDPGDSSPGSCDLADTIYGGSSGSGDRYTGSCDPADTIYGGSSDSGDRYGRACALPNDVLSVAPANYGGSSPPSTVAALDVKHGGSLSEGSQTLSIAVKQVPNNFWYWIVNHAERMINAIPGKYKGPLVSKVDRSSLLSGLALTADVVNRANMSHLTSGGTKFLWCRILRDG